MICMMWMKPNLFWTEGTLFVAGDNIAGPFYVRISNDLIINSKWF